MAALGLRQQPSHHAPHAELQYELPLWGKVASLQTDRGFGSLSCVTQTKPVFFHFTARQSRQPVDGNTLCIGEPILFIMGTDRRAPGKPRAVRWARVRDLSWGGGELPHDQASLDALRRDALATVSMDALWSLLRADWYVKNWGGNAPDDLNDSVLRALWFDRIASLSPHELAVLCTPKALWIQQVANAELRRRLKEWYLLRRNGVVGSDWKRWFQGLDRDEVAVAEFFIEQGIARNLTTRHWVRRIIDKGWLSPEKIDQWVGNDLAEAVPLFRQLSEERQRGYFEGWRRDSSALNALLDGDPSIRTDQLVLCGALAIDLETDGQDIWEVGCARAGQASMLYSLQQSADLGAAMAQLGERIRSAPLVVGHNLLVWDWPMVFRHINTPQPLLLWDTLLVQYLLEPQAQSHALGGSHHADVDALAAAQLFERQFKLLPAAFARSVLGYEFKDEVELLDAVIRLVGSTICFARALPDWLRLPGATGAALVLPDHRLHEVDWVPSVTVVSANSAENLPQHLLQIDAEVLAHVLEGEAGRQPAVRVVLAVARRAAAQGIALRFGMIPPWLLQSSAALELAVRQACHEPTSTLGLRVAPLPRDAQWLQTAGSAAVRLLGFRGEVLVYDQRQTASPQLSEMPKNYLASPLLRIRQSSGDEVWLQADGPARILSTRGRWRSFRTLPIPKDLVVPVPVHAVTRQRPILATRRTHVLYPGTWDQSAYWIEILRTFREVVSDAPGGVPILLVGSSCSRKLVKLLETSLAAIRWGEVRPAHRSRQAHLLRAAHNQWALVDVVEHWPQWLAIAQLVGVALRPVVEALPVEQWYAARHTQIPDAPGAVEDDSDDPALMEALDHVSRKDDGEYEDEDEEDVPDSESAAPLPALSASVVAPTAVWSLGAGALLEDMAELMKQHLDAWLNESGLGRAKHPVVLIDARAASLGKELATSTTLLPLLEAPLSEEEVERLNQVFEELQIRREPAPSDFASMEQFLVNRWNSSSGSQKNPVTGFKDSQKPVMEAICTRGSDVLVALPTGEGKSVLFQVPALCRGLRTRRLTLVLSPLKALMHDQVKGLRELGFGESADYLSGDRPAHVIAEVLQGVLDHRIVLLYVAPERLRSSLFVDVLRKRVESDAVLEYAVVDETHCVNQWGHEFRPDYLYALNLLLREFRIGGGGEHTPFLLLSATITASDKRWLQSMLDAAVQPGQLSLPLVARPDAFVQPLRSHIVVQPRTVHGRINARETFEHVLHERLIVITQEVNKAIANQRKTGQHSAVIIFVSRREHAEKLAQTLARQMDCAVDYFHAGLDTATREEVYQRFVEGKVTVLVSTKAFGMGMDIPHIHWAIHLAPPSFLEDYLQEVGRIGRGVKERANAQLDRLNAILLFSADDFESNRSQRQSSALQLSFIKDQYQKIGTNAQVVDGQSMVIVPHEGFDPPSLSAARRGRATKLRLALYWLERGRFITLHGSVPNLLAVTLHRSHLERIADEGSRLGGVVRALLCVEAVQQHPTQKESAQGVLKEAGGGWLGQMLRRIGDMVGLLLGTTQPPQSAPSQPAPVQTDPGAATEPAPGDALLNLSQIMLRCSLKTLGDVMACLVDLEKRGGLTLKRDFEFSLRLLAYEPDKFIHDLFDGIARANKELKRQLAATGKLIFTPSDLAQGDVAPTVDPKKSSQYQAAFDSGVMSLARSSGVRVRQIVEQGEVVRWEARLAPSASSQTDQRREITLHVARMVFALLRQKAQANDTVVSLKDLIEATRAASPLRRFRESDLQKALSLLAALRLVSLSVTLLPMSYVLTLDTVNGSLDSRQDLWNELEQINRLAELRNDAMEIFANLPAAAQNGFIEGYFSQTDAGNFEKFLEDQLRDMEDQADEGLSSFIKDKREHLRATGVAEFFKRYQVSQGSNQWKAISHPYDQHLLVNAGPGSGKTSVLVGRVVHLIREQHISPSEIIVLAFNRAVVFEIKRRIRELFRTLGYATYVKRLRVSTFHSFAMRSLAAADGEQNSLPAPDVLLPTFAQRLSDNPSFRQQVAGGCRSILVDEFQDVTEDIYKIIHLLHLGSGSSAGVMVIGDDDQDILRWQRPGGEFSERYFNQFANDFGGDALTSLVLGVNFRSGAAIVDRSQSMISRFFEKNGQSSRLKLAQQLQAQLQPVASVIQRIDSRAQSWSWVLDQVEQMCPQHALQSGGSLAILCRSNAEVAQIHRRLVKIVPGLAVQGNVNFGVADLRHVGLWLEHLESESQRQNQVLTHELKKNLLTSFGQKVDIPETRRATETDVRLDELWDLCCEEQAFPHLSDLIRFIQDLQTDELGRLCGLRQPQAVVSTIHKVKGLEFDRVIMLPSHAVFPYPRAENQGSLEMNAAEEARLLYVGMTRAKQQLDYFVGLREYAWGNSVARAFPQQNQVVEFLSGSHKDVSMGWAMEAIDGFNPNPDACQDYIEKEVRIGDPIILGGQGGGAYKAFRHQGASGKMRQIGFLAKVHNQGGPNALLQVSAVVRFRPVRNADGIFPTKLAKSVQQRGWGYAVLVSGQLF
jgi:superfamily II DNA helicase RecQ/superfamily I DNA/RNA helicase